MNLRTTNVVPCPTSAESPAKLIETEYDSLRKIAAATLRQERVCHALTGTALVHEVAAKLLDNSQTPANGRAQFLAFANKAMRNHLIDYAKARGRQKRGGEFQRCAFQDADGALSTDHETEELSALHDVLERLGKIDSRRVDVVRLRYLEGLSNEEIATNLQTSIATVKRDWIVAKAWLVAELRKLSTDALNAGNECSAVPPLDQ